MVFVQDDGAPAADESKPGGFGLIGMRERVAAIGGQVAFGPSRDAGWSVIAHLPLSSASSAPAVVEHAA